MTARSHAAPSEEALLRRIRWIRRMRFVAAVLIGALVGTSFYILLKALSL